MTNLEKAKHIYTLSAKQIVYLGATPYVVKSKRYMGNHKWILPERGNMGMMRIDLAQQWLDSGEVKFYAH